MLKDRLVSDYLETRENERFASFNREQERFSYDIKVNEPEEMEAMVLSVDKRYAVLCFDRAIVKKSGLHKSIKNDWLRDNVYEMNAIRLLFTSLKTVLSCGEGGDNLSEEGHPYFDECVNLSKGGEYAR